MKSNINESKLKIYAKRIRVRTLTISGFIVAVLLVLAYKEGGIKGILHTLYEHAWLEIFSGLLIYILVELKISEYGKMPIGDGRRNYDEISLAISKSKRTVRILDNDFSSFFEVRSDEGLTEKEVKKETERRKKTLTASLLNCLKNLDYNQRIEILLLHPNTPAAKQRHDDLNLNGFELFDNMNDGFQFLMNFIDGLEYNSEVATKNLAKKLEIKLFKTSYSVVFVSWDQNINFSVLPPSEYTDKETFKTLQHTPLAQYLKDNFSDIWNAKDKTVDIKRYKRIVINTKESDTKFEDIYWGHDNYNHDLPVFFCIEDKYGFDEITKNKTVEIWHDGEVKWGNVYEITNEKSADSQKNENKYITLYDYAKKQIEKKSGVPSYASKNGIKYIYEIKYTNRHRIMLLEDNYVHKHLKAKGYCYTPHNKYDVFLGTHLVHMLSAVYTFFKEENFNQHLTMASHSKKTYKRILLGYSCSIQNDTVRILNKNDSVYKKWPDSFTCLQFEREDIYVPLQSMDIFLHKTIEADIRRIIGHGHALGHSIDNTEINYDVNVLLIQSKVQENSPVEVEHFKDDYSDFENKAIYTVLHSVGKKYIKGGMPKVYINKKENSKPERTYNLMTSLDSLYVQNLFDHKLLSIESSNISFDKQEFQRKRKPNEEACGYRNIIVIEFHKT